MITNVTEVREHVHFRPWRERLFTRHLGRWRPFLREVIVPAIRSPRDRETDWEIMNPGMQPHTGHVYGCYCDYCRGVHPPAKMLEEKDEEIEQLRAEVRRLRGHA